MFIYIFLHAILEFNALRDHSACNQEFNKINSHSIDAAPSRITKWWLNCPTTAMIHPPNTNILMVLCRSTLITTSATALLCQESSVQASWVCSGRVSHDWQQQVG